MGERFGQLFLCSQLISYAYFNVSFLVLGREKTGLSVWLYYAGARLCLGPFIKSFVFFENPALHFSFAHSKKKKKKKNSKNKEKALSL